MGRGLVIATVLLVGASAAGAGPPSRRQADQLRREHPDPADRRAAVRKIAQRFSSEAASLLGDVSRVDPDLGVRVESIRALARMVADNATDVLLERLLAGGTEQVRAEIALAIDRREGGPEALRRASLRPWPDPLTRGLVIEAYGSLPTRDSLPHLVTLARSDDPFVRSEALRALGRRPDGRDELMLIVTALLGKDPDFATTMIGLDLVASHGDVDDLAIAKRFTASSRLEIRRLAEAVVARLEWAQFQARKKEAEAERYGFNLEPPRRPAARQRYDLVFGIDATGSMFADLKSLATDIGRLAESLSSLGADVRIGVVHFRDSGRAAGPWEVRALPLTHDLELVRQTLVEMRGGGANDRSASIARCLEECFDRIGWRWDAIRRVTLVADTPVDDLDAACRIAAFHRMVDGTCLDVWYATHTRTKVPKDFETLTAAGGGTLTRYETKGRSR